MKIGKRDTTKYKAWTLETEASLEEMIVAYRTITGACGQGVSLFMAEQNHAAKITVGYAIEKTRGRYGHDTFRIFFAPPSRPPTRSHGRFRGRARHRISALHEARNFAPAVAALELLARENQQDKNIGP